jgi:quercetin dioxygenase-like cupin family protein
MRPIARLAAPLLPLALLATAGLAKHSAALPEGTIQVPGGTGTWLDGPPTLPKGTKMMLLEGHPAKEGFFTMRLRLPAGTRIEPHWHPRDERVTILSGLAKVGFGDTFDESTMASFGPGSFYLNPPKSHHYVLIATETEMQLSGVGPWQLHPLHDRTRK